MTELNFAAAFSLGLLGSSHCLVMCGGIGAALGLNSQSQWLTLLLFQIGRVLSYTIIGGVVGALVGVIAADSIFLLSGLRVAAGILLIAMGCYISNWWRGLTILEQAGQVLWKRVQPLTKQLKPQAKATHAMLLGLCWGLLPCGLIYSALSWSATTANWQHSAALMFCFGLGTIPVMLGTGLAANQFKKLIRDANLRRGAAILLIIFGAWTSIIALQHNTHTDQHGAEQNLDQAHPHDMHNRS